MPIIYWARIIPQGVLSTHLPPPHPSLPPPLPTPPKQLSEVESILVPTGEKFKHMEVKTTQLVDGGARVQVQVPGYFAV